jgi:tetratricopeptide (TPR) repeat protein
MPARLPFRLWPACLLLLLIACGSTRTATSSYAGKAQELRSRGEQASQRMILKDGSLDLAVDDPAKVMPEAEAVAKQFGGYISSSEMGYAALLVKAEHLEEAMEALKKLGKVKGHSIRTRDATQAYQDYQIRLENAEKARGRYQELLEKATTVAEILPIEKELQRVTEEIERLRAQIAHIEQEHELSQIDLRWHKRAKPGPIGYVFVGLFKAVRVLFVRNVGP